MIIPIILLLSLGITVIFSSNHILATQQAIYGVVGLMGYWALRNFDYRALKSIAKPFYYVSFILLVVVFVLGVETRGSVRWIPLGVINLQPSELAKLSLILCLASFWSSRLPTWKNIGLSLLVLMPMALLIFRQPDLGTTLTVGFIWFITMFAADASVFKIGLITIASSLLAPWGWFLLKDYQRVRFLSFLYPSQDPLGVGYNVIQATIAVGSGELFGRGLGRGTQSRLQFLPEFRTDFIFAFIAEELGLIGSLIVLILYSIILALAFKVLAKVEDRFGQLLVVGVISMMFFQIVVNLGMNLGVMPITGITLPLLSYGGSSIITILLSLGLVESVKQFGLKSRQVESIGMFGV